MRIHHLSVEDALSSLQSNWEGLSLEESLRRLAEFGPNVLERVRGTPLWLRFAQGFTHLFALVLWLAALLAFAADFREPGQGMATLGVAIVAVILINGSFSFWQEYRAEKALHALNRLLPSRVHVVRSGTHMEVPTADLVPGDILLLEEGNDVPADCRVIEATGFRVSNATVTGESEPHSRRPEPDQNGDYQRSHNVLLAGTSVVTGRARALVFATGHQTAFGLIATLTQQAREPLSPLQCEIARLSRIITFLALTIGIVFFAIGAIAGLPFWANFIFAIGLIVANVPEGLLPTVTLALALGSQRMARRNALVRHLPAVETLGSATVICTDKTGTLTENRMKATRMHIGGKWVSDDASLAAAAKSFPAFFEVAGHCHSARVIRRHGRPEWMGDPMEVALVELALKVMPEHPRHPRRGELPFDSARRRMSTVHETPAGMILYCKGAPEILMDRCGHAETGDGRAAMTDGLRAVYQAAAEEMADSGLRVLAFAYRAVPVAHELEALEQDLTLAGLVGLEDPPRAEVTKAIQQCREASIKVIMVTGDHPHTARAIARRIGLFTSNDGVVITGEDLTRLSNTQLQLALDSPEILFARVQADQKMRVVSALRRKREIVAVTGDGVNDAPALKHAHIGIAMGRSGTDVARETADLVLLDDNFATIVAAIEEGRAIYANIRNFLTYILTSNIPELVPYLAFALFRIPLPLTVPQILAVDLGTDMLPALALGAEPPEPKTMQRPPRSRSERLLNWKVLARSYGFLGIMEATAGMAAYAYVLHGGNWKWGQALAPKDPLYLRATTACLTAIIVMQVANVFLCRSSTQSMFTRHGRRNPLLLFGIVVELAVILGINYTAWGQALFGTAALPVAAWLFIAPFALGMIFLEELRKWIARSFRFFHFRPAAPLPPSMAADPHPQCAMDSAGKNN